MPDDEGNTHIIYNLGFSRDGDHSCIPFSSKYDEGIRRTNATIVEDFTENQKKLENSYLRLYIRPPLKHRSSCNKSW